MVYKRSYHKVEGWKIAVVVFSSCRKKITTTKLEIVRGSLPATSGGISGGVAGI